MYCFYLTSLYNMGEIIIEAEIAKHMLTLGELRRFTPFLFRLTDITGESLLIKKFLLSFFIGLHQVIKYGIFRLESQFVSDFVGVSAYDDRLVGILED